MNTYIVLLRGINVGGHKKIPMAQLREILSKSGFEAVKTYIQTGNIILQSLDETTDAVETKIHKVIQSHFGFDVPVIAKTRSELQQIFDACPFPLEKKQASYFILLSEIPLKTLVDEVHTINYLNEEFHIVNDCLYLFSAAGYGNSKFNMTTFENKLKVRATSRNFKTTVKLLELSL
ncbi:DUF1697 domain-containing protein [Psychroserpens algicola]|uniref:DUF1697 domain-containing protein n=1 Tax=Psychroserpens algicola TaxID=1719034 RepID=UPI001953AA67|nr:DUF1697 domain-containing protein [Psychroserpens algicola]